ncbi:DNA repair protein RadC [Thiomicrospira microaerophila]|uniref:RadC family protein n=1 Tax=Thiomicrospira microaerophila TaxID=406020 RepID=UPI00200BE88E|nr:DNA repair protein RadC [Thiomicrospira microaerophila]UQB41731.1 DNA repair protein RadC [Thiomicrospira microaerophila]
MSIRDWHQYDRPREKLIHFGAPSLTDAELLAIFLRVGVKGKSAVELAQDLIDHFGDLHNLLRASQDEFCQAKGLGLAKYAQMSAVLEMARRHFESGLKKGDIFNSPELSARYFTQQIGRSEREQFACLLLDQQHQMIHFEVLFYGTVNQASVHPREIIKLALKHNAAAMVISHNHPSGLPKPSQSDHSITDLIKQALSLVEVRLLDHIIIGDHGRWHSMAQAGEI